MNRLNIIDEKQIVIKSVNIINLHFFLLIFKFVSGLPNKIESNVYS